MLNDFEPIIIDFPAKTDISIRPLFDLHIGSAQFNEKRFTQFVDDVLADPKCYVVIGGDLMDMGLKNSVTSCYEQTMRPSEQKRYCTELLRPLAAANRILCGTSGNHENRAVKECDDNVKTVYNTTEALHAVCSAADIHTAARAMSDRHRVARAMFAAQSGVSAAYSHK